MQSFVFIFQESFGLKQWARAMFQLLCPCCASNSALSSDWKWPLSFSTIVNKGSFCEPSIICFLTSQSGHLPAISAAQCHYSKLELHFFFFKAKALAMSLGNFWQCLIRSLSSFQFSASSFKRPTLLSPVYSFLTLWNSYLYVYLDEFH